ncbi:hypothetical protein UY3_15814 [Chelonia mydas]|uniref:DUF4587 domain-containing protein n=1 Tax=Chelonia mydas TaxID=8469 RepID=M7AR34_CHEMY|nr:hypothetical protein UY3_15814 [Chelonia mydas]
MGHSVQGQAAASSLWEVAFQGEKDRAELCCKKLGPDLIEFMMIQNAQMHQVIMNNMTMAALTSFGFSPDARAQVLSLTVVWQLFRVPLTGQDHIAQCTVFPLCSMTAFHCLATSTAVHCGSSSPSAFCALIPA